MSSRSPLVSAVILALFIPCGAALATTVLVPSEAASIQQGISMAAAGDTVLVACGTYYEHDIDLRNGVTVRGATDEPGCVVVDAQGQDRVFEIVGRNNVRLERLFITHGDNYGILVRTSEDISIKGCTLDDNYSGIQGGGLYSENSSLEVVDCLFTDNTASHRGGGLGVNSSTVTVSGCTFIGNEGSHGGGLGLLDSSGLVTRCIFEDNSVYNAGGGLIITDSDAEIEYCQFTGNQASYGGGLTINDSDIVIRFCTINGNTAENSGGGLYFHLWNESRAEILLNACSVYDNSSFSGGGLWAGTDVELEAFNVDVMSNEATYGPDGSVQEDAYLTCCDVLLERWGGNGTVHLNNAGCGVAVEGRSLSGVKGLFR